MASHMKKKKPFHMEMERTLSDSLQRHEKLAHAESWMVAVSGGVDSMVLLHFLIATKELHKKSIVVVHFNHQLRDQASEVDASWVENQCRILGVECVIGRGDVRSRARESRESIEMAARNLRYQFFAEQARLHNCNILVLAHHADDQWELILMRLMRGSGPGGLSGMSSFQSSANQHTLKLWRPFLGVDREAIVAYALECQFEWREDQSNKDLKYERNRVRHSLLPILLGQFGDSAKTGMLRSAELIKVEHDFLLKEADQLEAKEDSSLDFKKLHKGLQRELMRRALIRLGVKPEFTWIERLRLALSGSLEMLPSGCLVKVLDRSPWLEQVKNHSDLEFENTSVEWVLNDISGYSSFSQCRFEWTIQKAEGTEFSYLSLKAEQEVFDADRIGQRILLRHWRAGDRIQPIGAPGCIKLQDWFTNEKIDIRQRRALIIAEAPGRGIFWVQGMRIAEAFKVTSVTNRLLLWNCLPSTSC